MSRHKRNKYHFLDIENVCFDYEEKYDKLQIS